MYSQNSYLKAELKWAASRLLPLAFGGMLVGSAAFASPITYTMTATASGTLAGTTFTNAAITVTSIADTSGVFVTGGTSPDLEYEIIAAGSSIDIAGFAPATFTDQTFWEDPNGAGDIVFGDVAAGHGILGFTQLFVGLETYDLKSSFGPVSSPFDFVTSVFNGFQNIPTSDGSLSLVAMNDTFTADANVPEPRLLMIAGLGLMGLIAIRRHLRDIR